MQTVKKGGRSTSTQKPYVTVVFSKLFSEQSSAKCEMVGLLETYLDSLSVAASTSKRGILFVENWTTHIAQSSRTTTCAPPASFLISTATNGTSCQDFSNNTEHTSLSAPASKTSTENTGNNSDVYVELLEQIMHATPLNTCAPFDIESSLCLFVPSDFDYQPHMHLTRTERFPDGGEDAKSTVADNENTHEDAVGCKRLDSIIKLCKLYSSAESLTTANTSLGDSSNILHANYDVTINAATTVPRSGVLMLFLEAYVDTQSVLCSALCHVQSLKRIIPRWRIVIVLYGSSWDKVSTGSIVRGTNTTRAPQSNSAASGDECTEPEVQQFDTIDEFSAVMAIECEADCVYCIDAAEGAYLVRSAARAIADAASKPPPTTLTVRPQGISGSHSAERYEPLHRIWISQLMQVPGVAEEAAKVIADVYTSPGVLTAAYKEDTTRVTKTITNLTTASRGGPRRIGPVAASRLELLFTAEASKSTQQLP
eukprot:Lankesteria_metandrocarpae@DN2175_c0_g1_i1.p1